jgi:DNA-binding NtrC family response regulator
MGMGSSRSEEAKDTDADPRLPVSLVLKRTIPRLTWSGIRAVHELEIERRMLVGASAKVHVCIEDRLVSRLHAELEPRDDGVWIRDLGSKNGTWVHGVRVQNALVPDRVPFRVGNTTLTVDYSGSSRTIPLWPTDSMGGLVARSTIMRELFMRASQYAESDAPVLIRGETGTGKELLARAIHDASPRTEGPFVIVDCAALPENLLESELFGHAKGAFTGAQTSRAGAIETAHGGTVFLDEIGELPFVMQPKLLRVLESRTVRRVGEAMHREVDVRFVAATHRDLAAMVTTGAFREDLYFRMAVLPLDVPALREHAEDIPVLAQHFASRSGQDQVDPALAQAIVTRPWLGNVRELRNFMERVRTIGAPAALAMLEGRDAGSPSVLGSTLGPSVGLGNLPLPPVPLDRPFKELREAYVDHLEREYIGGLILKIGRNPTAIAEASGLDRTYVHRLLRKHDL